MTLDRILVVGLNCAIVMYIHHVIYIPNSNTSIKSSFVSVDMVLPFGKFGKKLLVLTRCAQYKVIDMFRGFYICQHMVQLCSCISCFRKISSATLSKTSFKFATVLVYLLMVMDDSKSTKVLPSGRHTNIRNLSGPNIMF